METVGYTTSFSFRPKYKGKQGLGPREEYSLSFQTQYWMANRLILIGADWPLFHSGINSSTIWRKTILPDMMEILRVKDLFRETDKWDEPIYDRASINQFIYNHDFVYAIRLAKMSERYNVSGDLLKLGELLVDDLRTIDLEVPAFKILFERKRLH